MTQGPWTPSRTNPARTMCLTGAAMPLRSFSGTTAWNPSSWPGEAEPEIQMRQMEKAHAGKRAGRHGNRVCRRGLLQEISRETQAGEIP